MNVRLTPEAEAQADACDAWWRENRDVRDLFARELRDTKAKLVSKPKIGTVYTILRQADAKGADAEDGAPRLLRRRG
jgi:hypothetical protein